MKEGVLMIIHIYPQGRLRTAKVSNNVNSENFLKNS